MSKKPTIGGYRGEAQQTLDDLRQRYRGEVWNFRELATENGAVEFHGKETETKEPSVLQLKTMRLKNPKNCEITFFKPDLSNRGEKEAFRAKLQRSCKRKVWKLQDQIRSWVQVSSLFL